MEIVDTYVHKGLRKKLVAEIVQKGITNESVLNAIGKVPRHAFMDSGFVGFSYKDQAFPIGSGQTISQPYTVAFQTQLLNPLPGEKILEIGTGSGYQTAVLIEMGAKVYTIERQRELYMKCQPLLTQLGYKPSFLFGDGFEGAPTYGPFDGILITAAAPEIPPKLLEQLKIGGRIVLPLGPSDLQIMTLVTKVDEKTFEKREYGRFVFVPMLKGTVK